MPPRIIEKAWPPSSNGAKPASSVVDRPPIDLALTRARGPALAVAVAVAGLVVLGGCGGGRSAAPAPTTAGPTTSGPTTTTAPPATAAPPTVATTTTTTAPSPPTTRVAARPSSPKATPAAASAALIDDWEGGRRSAAAAVATPAAVRTLFATAYAGQPLNNRGCSRSFQIVCSWGPYAGASSADALYEIAVTAAGRSWYVSSVVVES